MRINDNGVDRDMTADELIAHNEKVAQLEIELEREKQQIAAALEARKAPLRRLGLTDDEIDTVLGL